MAEDLDDGEFWLPPAFLSDDELLLEKTKLGSDGSFGSFGASPDLGSPVESITGSTETESDDEDFMAGLTRRIAQSTLQDGFGNTRSGMDSENPKARVLASSPQSTLCDLGVGCGCRMGSSHGSPNGPSRGSSPPPPPETWDLLYAAAGEVARMNMNDEGTGYFGGRSLRGHLKDPKPVPPPLKFNPNSHGGFHYDQSLNHLNFRSTQLQFQQLRRMEMMKKQNHGVFPQLVQTGARNEEFISNISPSRPLGLSPSAWPTLQQQQNQKPPQKGSGMRAMFLESPGTKRTSVGTGVFLPRRAGAPSESRKKPACPTVLLPARVVKALNLNMEQMGAQTQLHPRCNGGFGADSDVALKLGNIHGQQKRNPNPLPPASPEIRLPKEWTY